jgi:hypothetical protein
MHPDKRKRLGTREGSDTDFWFRFDGLVTTGSYEDIARLVLPYIAEAENFWNQTSQS